MSQNGFSEQIGFLRARIAAIEARDLPRRAAPRAGRAPLEALLGQGTLGEAMPARPSDAPAAAAFALALALRAQAARGSGALLWIVEDFSAREYGLPYGRGLMTAGAGLSRFALVRTRRPREALWAMEEALKSPACAAVVAESFLSLRHYGLSASRRLLLAARRGGALGLLVAQGQGAAGDVQRFSSVAEWRVEIAAAPLVRPHAEERSPGASRSQLPPLDPAAPFKWRLRMLKARAGLLSDPAEADPARWREIAFDPEKAVFRDAFPLPLPAVACDRPTAAEQWRESA